MTLHLPRSLADFDSERLSQSLTAELRQSGPDFLPVHLALQHGDYASVDDLQLTILARKQDHEQVYIRCGLFFHSLLSGCNCSDNAEANQLQHEYCELWISINRSNAITSVRLAE